MFIFFPPATAGVKGKAPKGNASTLADYGSWVVPAGVPSALAGIGGRVEANN